MIGRGLAIVGLLVVSPAALAWADDIVKPKIGGQVRGDITEMSNQEVAVRTGAITKRIPVNEIESISYDGEPVGIKGVRNAIKKDDYELATRELAKLGAADLQRPEVKADYEYYKALCAARSALSEGDSAAKLDAGRHLLSFEKGHGQNYHYFDACELLGDLLASLGKYDQAAAFYKKLEAAPWPDYHIRAGVLIGRTLAAQKKYPEAVAKLDAVLDEAKRHAGKDVERQAMAATLDRATCLAGTGKVDEGIKIAKDVIERAPKDDQELHARAYDALGTCYRMAGKKKEALLAFLHVDLLYSNVADQHAEALANLSTLWTEVNKRERGIQARDRLKDRYPYSQWAQTAGQ